ncbi:patatin-like phospholipase family protein [Cysteiniphilum litorale]|uniref:patatin-like phospholipase family protein n=1 Tax=Cysteiniphilum litorale TaxID=2056700 RepID=UPI003F882749
MIKVIQSCLLAMLATVSALNASPQNILVFSGGGVAGVAYAGALKAYEQVQGENLQQHVDAVAGTSAGSIAAGMVALGYNSREIKQKLSQINFAAFEDASKRKLTNVAPLLSYYGWNRGEKLYHFLQKVVKDKMGYSNATLEQVRQKTGKQIYIVVTDLSTQSDRVLSSEDPNTQNIPLALALRTSSSIPVFFDAIFFKKSPEGHLSALPPELPWRLDAFISPKKYTPFVDGGVTNNYPIQYMQQKFPNANITGFMLLTSNQIEWLKTGNVKQTVTQIGATDFIKFLVTTLTTVINGQYSSFVKNSHVLDHSILIDRVGVQSTDFNLSKQAKINLFVSGCESTLKFYHQEDVNNQCQQWAVNS